MWFQQSKWMQLVHDMSTEIIHWWTLWRVTIIFSLILRIERSKSYVGVYDVLVSLLNLETRSSNSAASLADDGFRQAALLPPFLLKIRPVRILDTIVCSGSLLWLFSPDWPGDAFELTLKVGFICPFVVIDPTDLGATQKLSQAICLSIFNLSPTRNTCLFTNGSNTSYLWIRAKSLATAKTIESCWSSLAYALK